MEHTPQHHENLPPEARPPVHQHTEHTEVVTNMDRSPLLSWGAVFGGVAFLLGICWLLNLLGMALGVSIADATDGEALMQGLPTGAVIWIVLSALIAYFVASLLTARLSGKVDRTAGMLHGMTLWSVGTVLTLILTYLGIGNLLETGYSLVSHTASAVSSAASGVASGAYSGATGVASLAADASDTRLAANIQARLKRRAASVISRTDAGEDVSQAEVEQAIESLDAETLQAIAGHIVAGEMTAARETLADETNLSESEIRAIVAGIEDEFEEQLGTDENQAGLAEDIANALEREAADYVAGLDARGGPEVNRQDIRQAIDQLTPENLQTVAWHIINGETRTAKDVLVANTNLTNRQINDIVDGVSSDVSRTVEAYREDAHQMAEAVSDYTEAVLWTVFVATAMGLAVSLLGGWLGTETSRRLQMEVRQTT